MMRCPACGAENSDEAKRCEACGERANRKPRRRDAGEEADTPFARRPDPVVAPALRAYRCAVYSLIPLAGLLLGPAAVILGLLAWRAGRREPEVRGTRYALIAVALGLTTLLCNGLGVALMVMGWRSWQGG